MKCDCEQKGNSTVISFLMELIEPVLKALQLGIMDRVEQTVNRIVRDVVGIIIFAFLGLMGFIFFLVGVAVWLSSFTGWGLGIGFMIVGGVVFVLALLIGLIKKVK